MATDYPNLICPITGEEFPMIVMGAYVAVEEKDALAAVTAVTLATDDPDSAIEVKEEVTQELANAFNLVKSATKPPAVPPMRPLSEDERRAELRARDTPPLIPAPPPMCPLHDDERRAVLSLREYRPALYSPPPMNALTPRKRKADLDTRDVKKYPEESGSEEEEEDTETESEDDEEEEQKKNEEKKMKEKDAAEEKKIDDKETGDQQQTAVVAVRPQCAGHVVCPSATTSPSAALGQQLSINEDKEEEEMPLVVRFADITQKVTDEEIGELEKLLAECCNAHPVRMNYY